MKLDFKLAEQVRVRITNSQQRQIRKLYKEVSKEISKKAKKAPKTSSDAIRKQYLKQLQKQIDQLVMEQARVKKDLDITRMLLKLW